MTMAEAVAVSSSGPSTHRTSSKFMILYSKDGVTIEDNSGIRSMNYNGQSLGRVALPDLVPVSWYYRNIIGLLEMFELEPMKVTALVLGGGPCVLSTFLKGYGVDVTTVDRDAKMFDLAKDYFGYVPGNDIVRDVNMDNIGSLGKFDIVISDLWEGHKNTGTSDRNIFENCVDVNGILISNHGDKCTFLTEL